MKIYFGHSRMLYFSEEEKEAIELMKSLMSDAEIVNPNIPEHQEGCWFSIDGEKLPGKEIDYFLRLTDDCEIGCFLQYYDGKWSAGSASEANYMLKAGKKVFRINLEKKRLDPVEEPVDAFTFEETLDKLVDEGIRDYL